MYDLFRTYIEEYDIDLLETKFKIFKGKKEGRKLFCFYVKEQ